MSSIDISGLLVAFALAAYLLYALVRGERL